MVNLEEVYNASLLLLIVYRMLTIGKTVGANYDSDDDVQRAPSRGPSLGDEWRYLAPFFLLICLFLLGVYTMLGGGSILWGDDGVKPPVVPKCAAGQELYTVTLGESCWAIADARGMSVKQLESINQEVNCAKLQLGQKLCVKHL